MYDFIIIGSGIAGNTCAYILSKKGYKCLVLEKTRKREEKICGGGVSYKAIKMLLEIGIDINKFLTKDISIVTGDVVCKNGNTFSYKYHTGYSIGTRRTLFDDFLMNEAYNAGATIEFDQTVSTIIKKNDTYMINGFYAHNVIIAVGAKGILNNYYYGQSVRVSAHITGEALFDNTRFYFWYFNTYHDDRYFWLFPIGKSIWNVGLWSRTPYNEIKNDFLKCINAYIVSSFDYGYEIKPRGTMLGNVDLRNIESYHCPAIGDYAGKNNIKNGGGIHRAIKSAILMSNNY